jgi:hypothetical protein
MKRLCVLFCALLFGFGCTTDGDKAMWDSAMKDLRGDNMQMRGSLPESRGMDESYSQFRYRD